MNTQEMKETDFADPIDWVYEVRHRISAKYGHNLESYMTAMRDKQERAQSLGRVFVRLPIARVAPAMA